MTNEHCPLKALIQREIGARGAIPFARFMELALYAPGFGYYERDDAVIGANGDFYTSVSVGKLFGELLAFQFAAWAAEARGERLEVGGRWPVQIVEAGAHDGRLAADILGWLRERREELLAATEYWIVEPSARRRSWQEKTLAEFAPHVRWVDSVRAVPDTGYRIVFGNELFDALPVHRLGWDARDKRWFEWGVGWDGGKFCWVRQPLQVDLFSELCPLTSALCPCLPDGYTIEVSPAAEQWWREAASTLAHGHLLCLDYGLTDDELLAPQRTQGTLRAYSRHRHAADPLDDPGEQDLTAHVHFSVLQRAGESAGLTTDVFVSQSQFLTGLAARTWAAPAAFGDWTAPRTRQFQTLTHPEHLGRAFRVLIQSRKLEGLTGG